MDKASHPSQTSETSGSVTNHNFLPHTDTDRQAMLETIGVTSQDDLFADIPEQIRNQVNYDVLPKRGYSELELQYELQAMSRQNTGSQLACFLGGGAYHRFIPPAVNTIAGRSEFYTAYTPYQPEVSQGTLQVTYEFQTMICELTGMDVANASVYDGANATNEAVLMALRVHKKRRTVLMADTLHPDYQAVTHTYLNALGGVNVQTFNSDNLDTVYNSIDKNDLAAIVVQQPNYLGYLDPIDPVRAIVNETGALFIVVAEPVSLGILEAPGNFGADIVVGDIQPLGNNLSYGGPYGGYVATKQEYVRQLPGRLVGKTLDKNNTPCYTLTLQTREQHIRRQRATSNICTNQALNILKATVYMTLMGPQGLRHLADISAQRAHALAEKLTALDGVSLLCPDKPFLNEFTIQLPVSTEPLLRGLEAAGFLGGIPVAKHFPERENTLLICCTEMTSPEQISQYAVHFQRLLESGLGVTASGKKSKTTTKSSSTLKEVEYLR